MKNPKPEREFRQMPKRVNWSLLTATIMRTYTYGDGGICADTGLHRQTISRALDGVLGNYNDLISIWNLAVDKVNAKEISEEDLQRCIPGEAEPIEHQS